ncbi:hypothetical protein M3Y95_00548900 [Aphelenchoides besseyi]|nr:hypothetical protein M3Y95_00548900 [Aphelenchoides besseyi]
MATEDDSDSEVFLLNRAARDRELTNLTNSINEKLLALKNVTTYDDLYTNDDILRTYSDSITSKNLQSLEERLSEIADRVNGALNGVTPTLSPKIEHIGKLKDRLSSYTELREFIRYLNMDYSRLQGSYTQHAHKLTKMRNLKQTAELTDDYDAEYLEVNVLKSVEIELELEIERFVRFLRGVFDTFMYFHSTESPKSCLLEVNANDPELISDACTALQLLGSFDAKIQSLIDTLWMDFFDILMSAADPMSQLSIVCMDSHSTQFSMNYDIKSLTKHNPMKLVEALEQFFTALHNVLRRITVDGKPMCEVFGAKLAGRLVEKFVLRLCAAAATSKAIDEDRTKKLLKLIERFDTRMKELGFFTDDKFSAVEVFNRSSRLIVNQRCKMHLANARSLVFKPSTDLVSVSGVNFDWARSENDLSNQLDQLSISKTDLTTGSDSKFLSFRRCSISTSTEKLVQMFGDLLQLALDSDDEMESNNYFQAALVIIDTFLVSTPRLHQQTLLSVPHSGAVFYNDCHYIFHALTCFKMRLGEKLGKLNTGNVEYNFAITFKDLRQSALKILNHHVDSVKRQISTTLNADKIFLSAETNKQVVERTLSSCTMHLEQLHSVWKEVMSDVVFELTMGTLVAHFLSLLAKIVLSKEDLPQTDADLLGELLPVVLHKTRRLMTINNEEGIHTVCKSQYFRLEEIIFCLNANLASIGDRWCEGVGPLSIWLKPFEVRGLICALFQNTSKRAALLDSIKSR